VIFPLVFEIELGIKKIIAGFDFNLILS